MSVRFQLVHYRMYVFETVYVASSRHKQHRVTAYHVRFLEYIHASTTKRDGVPSV